jgi:hypothetical protein
MNKIINDKSDIVFGYNIELYNNNNYYIFKALKESMMYNNALKKEVVVVDVKVNAV